jgi:transcriptional regulator with XRE-family HTH domain
MSTITNVGEKITSIRLSKRIELEELAERCGFTAALMAKIEENEAIPSLGHLIKVARALGVRLGTFLDDMDQLGPVISRKGDLIRGNSFSSKNSSGHNNLNFFSLASDKSGRHMEPFIVEITPSTGSDFAQSSHEGEEFIYVLAGSIEINYGKTSFTLSEGDSIYYDSVVDHNVHAANGSPAKILAVVYASF